MGKRSTLAALGCLLIFSSHTWAGGTVPSDDQYGLAGAVTDILLAPCYLLFELAGGARQPCGQPQRCYVVCVPAKEVCQKREKLRTGGQVPRAYPYDSRTSIPCQPSQPPLQPSAAVPSTQMIPSGPRPAEVPTSITPQAQPKLQPTTPRPSEVPPPQLFPPENVQPITPKSSTQRQPEAPTPAPIAPKPAPPVATELPRIEQPALPVPPSQPGPPLTATREQAPKPAPEKAAVPPKAPEPQTRTIAKPETKRRSGKETPSCGGYYPPAGCYPQPWCR